MQEFCAIFYIGGGKLAFQERSFGVEKVFWGMAKAFRTVVDAVLKVGCRSWKVCSEVTGSKETGSGSAAFFRSAGSWR